MPNVPAASMSATPTSVRTAPAHPPRSGRLVQLAAALVVGLQVTQAPLKGLASGTRDGLLTTLLGEALAATALPQPQSRDQLELDALNKYPVGRARGRTIS